MLLAEVAAAQTIEGWPQAWRDLARTGESPEPALVDPSPMWLSDVDAAVVGLGT